MSSLGDRMKGYENVNRHHLIKRMPVILRVDGRAFHTYTRRFQKPWDRDLQNAMATVAKELVKEIQGARFAYTQSDEISVLLVDYNTFQSEPWFGGNIQKVVSVGASIATATFNQRMTPHRMRGGKAERGLAHFDARVFNLPKEEVVNYFIWRQRDAVRNSISGLAQAHFSHKSLHGLSNDQMQEKLMEEKEINWNDVAPHNKRGMMVVPEYFMGRKQPLIKWDTPDFGKNRDLIQRIVDEVEEG